MSIDAIQTIKGQPYRLIKLDPLRGGLMATRVAQQLAGAVSDAQTIKSLIKAAMDGDGADAKAAMDGGGADAKAIDPMTILEDQSQLVVAMAGGITKIDAEALYQCAIECISNGRLFADHKLHDEMAINKWFAERPDHLLLVLAWALKVNCAGFFGLGGRD